ncbi:1-phosphofructokinase [Reinekea marinisedimentorum]|uniref:Phosphofructokinase n=1 Tax=Reinekea marinisedimentorum TaxID=230495 RepID=A0A4R3HRW7_9GAMM|nr:1-phosphofructokinase [Reinekea marinisedimentorum]TCS35877.1 1-phosphofructokinase [Reinekea marinisedimentorum]
MTKPVLTVTLNPALDLTVSLSTLHAGEVNKAQAGSLRAAGKGINVAAVLKDLDHTVTATGFLGENNHAQFQDFCEQKAVDNRFLFIPGATRINVKISEVGGRVTDVNLPGLNVPASYWQLLKDNLVPLAKQCSAVVLAGSLPPGLQQNAYAELIHLLKDCDVPVVVDTSGEALLAAVAAKPALIKPNVHELEVFTGQPVTNQQQLLAAGKKLIADGIANVVISDGEKGCYWLTENRIVKAVPPLMDVVSTVGAGDSLVAGLTHCLVNKTALPEGLQLACAVSAHAVEQVGVGILSAERLQQILELVRVEDLSGSL